MRTLAKIEQQPGESQRISVPNCAAASHPFSYFVPTDTADLRAWAQGDWATPSGRFVAHVGGSSANTRLNMPIDLDLTSCTQ